MSPLNFKLPPENNPLGRVNQVRHRIDVYSTWIQSINKEGYRRKTIIPKFRLNAGTMQNIPVPCSILSLPLATTPPKIAALIDHRSNCNTNSTSDLIISHGNSKNGTAMNSTNAKETGPPPTQAELAPHCSCSRHCSCLKCSTSSHACSSSCVFQVGNCPSLMTVHFS